MEITGNTKILGIGTHLPSNIVSSVSLMEEIHSDTRFGLPTDWIDRKVGITERRMASPGTLPSDLAIQASINAITNSGIHPRDIDAIIYAGIETDFIEPSTAHVIQNAIESDAICFDINNACQGPINAMAVADGLIQSGHIETALICTAALTSRVMKDFIAQINQQPDEYLRNHLGILTCGDAGAALIVTKSKDGKGLKHLAIISIGGWEKHCYYRYVDGVIEGEMLMKGMTDEIDRIHTSLISNTYHYLNWTADDVDHLISHQVGHKTFRDLSKISGVPMEKMPEIYKNHGNITTCSIPFAMEKANMKAGDKVLLMGGASGFSSFQGGMIC